jgi:hypothetical protein
LNKFGGRVRTCVYALQNFDETVYALDSASNDAFGTIGNWSDGLYSDCDVSTFSGCKAVKYNTKDNSLPLDHSPHSTDHVPDVVKIAAYFKTLGDDGLPMRS